MQTDKYYRNIVSIISDQGVEIDEGSLWKFDANLNLLVLVDDDEFHTSKPKKEFMSDFLYRKPSN